MTSQFLKRYFIIILLASAVASLAAQNSVPMGIHYQAVARDSYGQELINKKISVKFSIISGDPLASPVYQEVHQNIITSKFGVFSLVIGHGIASLTSPCTTLSQIAWDQANHFLKVEVKFENDFMDMGTMQFLAVPYALYAQKSLEPGPEGPKGDRGDKGEPGDPATDNQTLSFDGSNLSISGAISTVNLTPLLQTLQVSNDGTGGYNLSLSRGNTINLATIEKDGNPYNEIQDLSISSNRLKITNNANATDWDLSPYLDNTDGQSLLWDPINRILGISGSTKTISLRELENDADSSITNEIQDLQLIDNKLSITGKTGASEINMNAYLDNTDNQTLAFTEASNTLAVSGANSVNLGVYRDNTDSQTLTYTEGTNELEITGGNKITIGSMVAFRAKNNAPDASSIASYAIMTYDEVVYTFETYFNASTGVFTAPYDGIYTFNISYYADGSGDGREVAVYLNGALYEKLALSVGAGTTIPARSITMKLNATNTVSVVIYTGLATQTGTGSFSGFKVY